jgi:hypothetical protein
MKENGYTACTVWLTQGERLQLLQCARDAQLQLASFVRQCALDYAAGYHPAKRQTVADLAAATRKEQH